MSGAMIVVIGLLYAWCAADMLWRGNYGLAISYACWAAGNVGLFMVANERQ